MWGYRRRKFLCKCSTVAQHQPICMSHGNHGREMKNSLHILFLKILLVFINYKKIPPRYFGSTLLLAKVHLTVSRDKNEYLYLLTCYE